MSGSQSAPSPQAGGGGAVAVPVGAELPSGLSIRAMVCGIIGVTLLPTVYGMVISVLLGPVALVLGLVAWSRVQRGEAGAGRYALAGVVLGAVAFVVSAVVIALVAAGVLFSSDNPEEKDKDSPGVQVRQESVPRWAGTGAPAPPGSYG